MGGNKFTITSRPDTQTGVAADSNGPHRLQYDTYHPKEVQCSGPVNKFIVAWLTYKVNKNDFCRSQQEAGLLLSLRHKGDKPEEGPEGRPAPRAWFKVATGPRRPNETGADDDDKSRTLAWPPLPERISTCSTRLSPAQVGEWRTCKFEMENPGHGQVAPSWHDERKPDEVREVSSDAYEYPPDVMDDDWELTVEPFVAQGGLKEEHKFTVEFRDFKVQWVQPPSYAPPQQQADTDQKTGHTVQKR